jgi:DNA-binding CsgD family transcriptional regulator
MEESRELSEELSSAPQPLARLEQILCRLAEHYHTAGDNAHGEHAPHILVDFALLPAPPSPEEFIAAEQRLLQLCREAQMRLGCLYPPSLLRPVDLPSLAEHHDDLCFGDSFAPLIALYRREWVSATAEPLPAFASPFLQHTLLLLASVTRELRDGWDAWEDIIDGTAPALRLIPPETGELVWLADAALNFRYLSGSSEALPLLPGGVARPAHLDKWRGRPFAQLLGEHTAERIRQWSPPLPEGHDPRVPQLRFSVPPPFESASPIERELLCTAAPLLLGEQIIGYTGSLKAVPRGVASTPRTVGALPRAAGKADAEELLAAARISARERQIIALLLRGYRNKEIGESLNIAEITVKKHLSNIYQKLGVKNRFDLARLFGFNVSLDPLESSR